MSAREAWKSIPTWPRSEFDGASLRQFQTPAEVALEALYSTSFVTAENWKDGSAALTAEFGLGKTDHCFSARPHDWVNFLEPQITRGFAHFLDQGPRVRRISRSVSFARAVYRAIYGSTTALEGISPYRATVLPEEGRCDILLELDTSAGIYGIVLEAKIGASLSETQLQDYRKFALARAGWCEARAAFLVVLSERTAQDIRVLDKNPTWSSTTWWDLMSLFEEEIGPNADCPEFQRFRRSVWWQAY